MATFTVAVSIFLLINDFLKGELAIILLQGSDASEVDSDFFHNRAIRREQFPVVDGQLRCLPQSTHAPVVLWQTGRRRGVPWLGSDGRRKTASRVPLRTTILPLSVGEDETRRRPLLDLP